MINNNTSRLSLRIKFEMKKLIKVSEKKYLLECIGRYIYNIL